MKRNKKKRKKLRSTYLKKEMHFRLGSWNIVLGSSKPEIRTKSLYAHKSLLKNVLLFFW